MVLKIVLGVQKGHLKILVKADGPYFDFMKTIFDFVCFPEEFVCFQDSIFWKFWLVGLKSGIYLDTRLKIIFFHIFSNF